MISVLAPVARHVSEPVFIRDHKGKGLCSREVGRIAMQTQLKPESVEGPKRVALLPARIAGLGGSLPQEGAGANAVPGLESPSPACRAALRFAEKS